MLPHLPGVVNWAKANHRPVHYPARWHVGSFVPARKHESVSSVECYGLEARKLFKAQ